MAGDQTTTPVRVRLPSCGVFVFESQHARGFRTGLMRHPFLKVLLVLVGRGSVHTGRRKLPFSPGDIVFVPPGVGHRLEDDPESPASLLAVCAKATPVRRAATGAVRPRLRVMAVGPETRRRVEGTLRRMCFEQAGDQPARELMLQSLLDAMLVIVARAPAAIADRPVNASGQRVRAVADRLAQSFFDPPSLDEAAEATGLSRRQFTELFRQTMGRTYHEYLQSLRVGYAQRLLSETDESVAAVAFACGFNDLSTFYRAFNRGVGCSPLAYRASAGAGSTG